MKTEKGQQELQFQQTWIQRSRNWSLMKWPKEELIQEYHWTDNYWSYNKNSEENRNSEEWRCKKKCQWKKFDGRTTGATLDDNDVWISKDKHGKMK